MPPKPMTFTQLRQRATGRIVEFLQSRSGQAATVQDVVWFCRSVGMPGMADSAIDWLEQAGAIRYDRVLGAVYLQPVRGGATATVPAPEERPDGAGV